MYGVKLHVHVHVCTFRSFFRYFFTNFLHVSYASIFILVGFRSLLERKERERQRVKGNNRSLQVDAQRERYIYKQFR